MWCDLCHISGGDWEVGGRRATSGYAAPPRPRARPLSLWQSRTLWHPLFTRQSPFTRLLTAGKMVWSAPATGKRSGPRYVRLRAFSTIQARAGGARALRADLHAAFTQRAAAGGQPRRARERAPSAASGCHLETSAPASTAAAYAQTKVLQICTMYMHVCMYCTLHYYGRPSIYTRPIR